MARKSIFSLANKDSKIKDMMEDCYLDLEEDTTPEFISSQVMALNLLFSGKINGGIPIGKMSMISAPSMLGKSLIGLSFVREAQKKGMQVILIDTERAFSTKTAKMFDINMDHDKLFVFQDNSIEKLITFVLNIFEGMTREERKNTLCVMDSWGTLITSKTIKDGLDGRDVMDMTDPKKKNKLANIILNTKGTWFIINHVYDNIGGFGEMLAIPGGRKIMFNCDCVVLATSRAKDNKNAEKELKGHIISAKTYKSRYSKEQSKLKFKIKHNGGLDVFYGILDDAVDGGYVIEGKVGKSKGYFRAHIKDDLPKKEINIYNSEFWLPIFNDTDFKKYLENKYTFDVGSDILKQEKDIDKLMKKK